jgi:tRNA(Glu) U13 pseudouridine synthase TruD
LGWVGPVNRNKQWRTLLICCYPFFGSHTKNEKIQKYIYQKIFERNPKNNRSEKRMLECWKKGQNWLRRFKNAKG